MAHGSLSDQKDLLRNFFGLTSDIIFNPQEFFKGMAIENGYSAPLLFLVIYCLFFTICSSIYVVHQRLTFAFIFFSNALLTPFILAFLLFFLLRISGKNITYQVLFSINAYAGVTLLFSWVPILSWFTEAWKFYLIGVGLTRCCKLSIAQSALYIILMVLLLLLIIWSIQPLFTTHYAHL